MGSLLDIFLDTEEALAQFAVLHWDFLSGGWPERWDKFAKKYGSDK